MSKRAKYVPLSHKAVIQWLGSADIDWVGWEARCSTELGDYNFRFNDPDRKRLTEAIQRMGRPRENYIAIEEAKSAIRRIIENLKTMNLPDRHLLAPDDPTGPSDFLMRLGFEPVADIFRVAMCETLEEAEAGEPVLRRLAIYLARLRVNKCAIYSPREEATAAHLIKHVFKDCGLSTKVTSNGPSSGDDGNETLSVFEEFVLEHIMPDLGSDPAARKILKRRLEEAEKALRAGNLL